MTVLYYFQFSVIFGHALKQIILLLKIYLNILKHTERLKSLRILLTVSTCMLWLLQAIRYSQVLVHSTVVNSRNSLRYILTFA